MRWTPLGLMMKSGHGDLNNVFRGDIFLVALNPMRGSDFRKTRPCVGVSPDKMNSHPRIFKVAPLTTGGHPYPICVRCGFDGKDAHIVADQLRAVERGRLVKHLGSLSETGLNEMLVVHQAMFAR